MTLFMGGLHLKHPEKVSVSVLRLGSVCVWCGELARNAS